uniref:Titin n=1 Tax=Echeneis naucrates TaxID=173247 RepID=A0A665TLF6_ECHNA
MKASFTNIIGTEFVVTGLTEDQVYEFRVIARNAAGVFSQPSDSTGAITAKDEVDPPKIDLEAKYCQAVVVNAGETFKLEAAVSGKPVPNIHWLKDGQEITEAARIELKNTEFIGCLVVKEAIRVDGGQYTLLVKNVGGEKSVNINVKVLDRPGPPEGPISIYGVTSEKCSISWKPPIQDGGSDVSHYIVERRETSRLVWTVVEPKVQTLNLKITKLLPGNEYIFRVGYDLKIEVPIAGHPKPTISWTKDGAALKQTTRVNVTDGTHHTTLTIKDANREDGGMYSINVSNALGSKDATIEVITLDKPGPPTGPVKLDDISAESITLSWEPPTYTGGCQISNYVAVIVTRHSVKLRWTAPEYDGGSLITGYIVEKRDLPEGKWMKASFANVIENEFIVTGLTEDSKYDFRVIARNAAGAVSKPSECTGSITAKDEVEPPKCETDPMYNQTIVINALLVVKDAIRVDGGQYTLVLTNVAGTKTVPFSVKVLDRPGPSEGPLTVSNVTEEKCSLSWLPPRHDGGASVSHYIIQKRETSRLAWTVVSSDCGATMFKVTKLLKGNEYIFRVMAVNKYGVGEPLESVPVVMRNPFVSPGSPRELEITNITRDSMTVCWNRPETTGGSDITGYIIEKRDRAGVRWTKCNKRRVTDLRFRVTGLTEDHEYEFRVSAENTAGVGQPSPPTPYNKACDPTFEPGPPTNAHVVDTTKDSVSLACICTPPSGVNVTKFTITKLIEHQEYKVRICAINKLGVGEPTEIQGVVKPIDKIDPPEMTLDSDLRKGIVVRAGASMRIC